MVDLMAEAWVVAGAIIASINVYRLKATKHDHYRHSRRYYHNRRHSRRHNVVLVIP